MKFKELKKGNVYQDENGFYRFIKMRNNEIAEFEEITFNKNDEIIVIDNTIYKTQNDIRNW